MPVEIYLSPRSQIIETIKASLAFFAISKATYVVPPEDGPEKIPSFAASSLAVLSA